MRLGPGPVFVYEAMMLARRRRTYAARSLLVGLILIGMAMAAESIIRPRRAPLEVSLGELAVLGERLYKAIAWIELTWILLAAPAATAGAICLDRDRGTLDHMLATDLSNAEIVLGKLAARLLPVLGVIAATIPVLAMAELLGGIEPAAILGLAMIAFGCAFLGGSIGMVPSVYGRRTHEVLMLAYLLIISWVLAPDVLRNVIYSATGSYAGAGPWASFEWLDRANPYFLALAPYSKPGWSDVWSALQFLAGALAVSGLLLAMATMRVRRVALKHAGRPASGRRRRWPRMWLPGPSIDVNPVAWREWHRVRPSLMIRIVWGLYAAMGLVCMVLSARTVWDATPDADETVGVIDVIQVSIGLLLLGVSAATSLAEERVRGSLDILLSTPISTHAILTGKWRGGYRRALGVAIWPALIAAPLVLRNGYWSGYLLLLALVLAHAAVITSLGLVVATWVGHSGRAVIACVTVMVLSWIGWVLLLVVTMKGAGPGGVFALVAGNPQIGVLFATAAVSRSDWIEEDFTHAQVFAWTVGWILTLALMAWMLFHAALAAFDKCLGRIPDAGLPRPRPQRSSPELEPQINKNEHR